MNNTIKKNNNNMMRCNVRVVLVDTGERLRWAPEMEMDHTLIQNIANGTPDKIEGVVFTISKYSNSCLTCF